MPTCGFIKVQPNGLKEKAAKSTQRWDPVSKRMLILYPRPPPIGSASITRVGITNTFLISWSLYSGVGYYEQLRVTVDIYQSTTQDTISGTKIQTIQSTNNLSTFTAPQIDRYYYAIVNGENSNSITTNIIRHDNIITTIAGDGTIGFGGDTGAAISAQLSYPNGVSLDSAGNIYIADTDNNRIRKVTISTGDITTVADDQTVTTPLGVSVDSDGNIYIADTFNHRIRKVSVSTGDITTVAGNGSPGFSGDTGAATFATLRFPRGVAVDSTGNIYIADTNNNCIRKVTISTGDITTVAGTGGEESIGSSGDGGPAGSSLLHLPYGVAVDSAGNIYIADTFNHRIRKVSAATGNITRLAGLNPGFAGDGQLAFSAQTELNFPHGVAVDSAGNIYIADTDNNCIRKVTVSTGIISTVVGLGGDLFGGFSGDTGAAISARLRTPRGVAVDSAGNIYIADTYNHRIRKVNVFN